MARTLTLVLVSAGLILAGCAGKREAEGEWRVLEGRATYLARMAAPPGVCLHVQLVDLSALGESARLAEQTRMDVGQPPYAFELRYDTGWIRPGGRYAVQATLEDRTGRPLFATPEPQSVALPPRGPVEVAMNPVPHGSPAAGLDATRRTVVYRCDGRDVAVSVADGAVLLHLPGRVLRLERVESASGARYRGDGHAFWDKGATARLVLDGGTAVECRRRDRGD